MKNLFSLSVPIGFILCGAGATSLMLGQPDTSRDSDSSEASSGSDESSMIEDATYYMFLSEIEIYDKALDDDEEEDWDDDDDAPDLYYEIEFQGKRVFKSPQRDNVFIANWRGITLPVALEDLTSVVKGDININVDFEQIVQAARVKGDSEVKIKIYDNDSLTPKDDVGTITINMADLEEGTNMIENDDRREDQGWKNIQLIVVKREGSVKDFLLPLLRETTQQQLDKSN